jgi:TPR repeat protein
VPPDLHNRADWRRRYGDVERDLVAWRDVHVHQASSAESRQEDTFISGLPPAAPPKPVGEWHPLDLGVHPAIDTDADGELPPYVCRSHDRKLRGLLSAVPRARMVILVGGSCTGKTRACYEAVRECLAGWPMSCPADAPELERLLSEQQTSERAVVWLDEADVYLSGRLPPVSRAAQCLQRVLADSSGSLLVIGSMRTERWAELTAEPKGGGEDLYRHARRLLGMREARKIEVPEDFSSAEPADLRELGLAVDRDPRLAVARRVGGEALQITQVLAGGRLLLDRYLHPPGPQKEAVYSRAVVTAAMDARRLGHWDAIPPSLLKEAVAGYLTASERAAPAHWFDRALAAAAEPVRGVSALTPVRRRAGVGDPDGYVLHDYLDEHAQRTRVALAPPADLWDGVLAHSASGADLARVAVKARRRGLYRYAVLAAARAAEAGDTGSVLFVARLLDEAKRTEECIIWLLPFADAGDKDAMLFLSEELLKSSRENRSAESLSWERRAAESGDTRAMWRLAERFGRADLLAQLPELVEEGIGWLRQLADRGHLEAMRRLTELFNYMRRADDAAFWRDQHVRRGTAGHKARPEPTPYSRELFKLGSQIARIPSVGSDDDISAVRSRAVAGDPQAMEQLGVQLNKEQQTGEAMDWLARAADAGNYHAALKLAEILHQAKRNEEALAVIQRAAVSWGDHFSSLDMVLPFLTKVGGQSSAESFLMTAAKAGNNWATAYLAPVLKKQGRIAEAILLLESTAEGKHLAAMEFLGVLLEEAGPITEAEEWYRRVDQNASAEQFFLLASLLEGGGWPERALVRYRTALECEETDVMEPLADLLQRMGRTEEAERLLAYGIEAGGRTALPWRVPRGDPTAGPARTE